MQYICRWTLPHRYPGSLNHLQTDARTFADWGVITNYYRCRWHLHCFGAVYQFTLYLIVGVSGVGTAQSNMVKTFCKRATKGLLICFTICFLLSVGQPDIFTRWTMSNLMDAIQTLPLWRWAEINLTRTFYDEIWWVKYGPGPGFLWLTARLVMPNLEPPYAPLGVQLCTSASGLFTRFDNK